MRVNDLQSGYFHWGRGTTSPDVYDGAEVNIANEIMKIMPLYINSVRLLFGSVLFLYKSPIQFFSYSIESYVI